MNQNPIRWLSLFNDEEADLGERVEAAGRIASWARWTEPAPADLEALAERLLGFWQGLCSPREGERLLYHYRLRAARACYTVSPRLPHGPTVYHDYPRPGLIWKENRPTSELEVEGADPRWDRGTERGHFKVYMASIYQFHFEYPIERRGIQKDLISVIERDGTRTPLLDWCREHRMFVVCSRCGLDITLEVSLDCPWRKLRRSSRPRPELVR